MINYKWNKRDVQNYRFLIPILKHIKQYRRMITHRASESVYCTTKRRWWFESFDYDEQWAGMADSKIFESNLEASQVPTLGVTRTKYDVSPLIRKNSATC